MANKKMVAMIFRRFNVYFPNKCSHKLSQWQRQAAVPTRKDERHLGMPHYILDSLYYNEDTHMYVVQIALESIFFSILAICDWRESQSPYTWCTDVDWLFVRLYLHPNIAPGTRSV